jgi:hypothetical protein
MSVVHGCGDNIFSFHHHIGVLDACEGGYSTSEDCMKTVIYICNFAETECVCGDLESLSYNPKSITNAAQYSTRQSKP